MPHLHFLLQLREDVASCQPLATALDNGRVILCDRIADPWVRMLSSSVCRGPAQSIPPPTSANSGQPGPSAALTPHNQPPPGSPNPGGCLSAHSSAGTPVFSPCRTLSGSAWAAAPSSSSPTSSSPSGSPNISAPFATGSCKWQARGGRMQRWEMWAPPQPPQYFLLLLQLHRVRGDLSLPHPPCHSTQALGWGGLPGALHPRNSQQTHSQALQGSGSLQHLTGLRVPLMSLPRCPSASEHPSWVWGTCLHALWGSGSLWHLFLGV